MNVYIRKCSDPIGWYNDQIGCIFTVSRLMVNNGYQLSGNTNLWIDAKDCIPLGETDSVTSYTTIPSVLFKELTDNSERIAEWEKSFSPLLLWWQEEGSNFGALPGQKMSEWIPGKIKELHYALESHKKLLTDQLSKPSKFNLTGALNGMEFQCQNGSIITDWEYFEDAQILSCCIKHDGRHYVKNFTRDGAIIFEGRDLILHPAGADSLDLCMVPVLSGAITQFLNIYECSSGKGYITAGFHDSFESAEKYGKEEDGYLKTIPVTFTVEK